MMSLASNRLRPEKAPQFGVKRPVLSMTSMEGRLWRFEASKSLGSCDGVIFTAPGNVWVRFW